MIHTASLVHDDIIDKSSMRRSKIALNVIFGNRVAAMTGNYIMSSAARAISHLQNPSIVEILCKILHDLVSGELLQLTKLQSLVSEESFDLYLRKSYLKTASLISHCCKAVSYISNPNEGLHEECFNFGRNIGLAFQLVDDALDYMELSQKSLGKPCGVDLKLGCVTAPVLLSARMIPELDDIFMRNFSLSGDVEKAVRLVKQGNGVAKTLLLAAEYVDRAMYNLDQLGWTPAHSALKDLCQYVVSRKK